MWVGAAPLEAVALVSELFDDHEVHWTDADVQRAYAAGIEAGIASGMCTRISQELGALADAQSLLGWVQTRIMATAKYGEPWADLVAGDRPTIGGDRRE